MGLLILILCVLSVPADMSSDSSCTFSQLVVGPPGSGKSTYCAAMKQFLTALGRPVAIVNLDPANDSLPYACDVDISELVTLDDVTEKLHLGPNGGLVYCMEFLEKNIGWLTTRLGSQCAGKYVLFDCPGQVELYTHHCAVRNVASALQAWNYRVSVCVSVTVCVLEAPSHIRPLPLQLVAVHLVDSHYCSDPGRFISVLLTSLSTMLQLELPHVNVLSKVDLMQHYGKLGEHALRGGGAGWGGWVSMH